MKKVSFGEIIASSVLPFMFDKHTVTREECIDMIKNPVNNKINAIQGIVDVVIQFMNGEKVTILNTTYIKGVNDHSFLKQIELMNSYNQ